MRPTAAICSAIAMMAMTCPALAQLVLPPEEYDHPYEGQMWISWKDSAEEVRAACKTPLAMGLGCAYRIPEGCVIVIARTPVLEAAGVTVTVVMRHETAHCNGWPKEHPGARMYVRETTKKAPTP
jgi:hypothetical protein